jgi:hypothetical protein
MLILCSQTFALLHVVGVIVHIREEDEAVMWRLELGEQCATGPLRRHRNAGRDGSEMAQLKLRTGTACPMQISCPAEEEGLLGLNFINIIIIAIAAVVISGFLG